MSLNRFLTIAAIVLGLLLAALCVYGQVATVKISWDAYPLPWASFEVFAGTQSMSYSTNWPVAAGVNETTWSIPEHGRWYFALRAVNTNGDVSYLSDEVSVQTVPAPVIGGTPHVLLTTVFEASPDLVRWHSHTSTPTWIAATNAQEFYRKPELRIERAMAPN